MYRLVDMADFWCYADIINFFDLNSQSEADRGNGIRLVVRGL